VSASVLGLFNLRGEPLPLVDVRTLLDLPPLGAILAKHHVMVVRTERLAFGVSIDAMDSVVTLPKLLPPTDDNPLVVGFLPTTGASEAPTAVLNPTELFARLERLKF
jgi:chemotaxis signal transduction protein